MKVKKLIKKLYKASLDHNGVEIRRLTKKALQKSLKHKNTVVIR
jgi:hypothetical protein